MHAGSGDTPAGSGRNPCYMVIAARGQAQYSVVLGAVSGTLLSVEQKRLTITQALFLVQTRLFQIQVVLLQDVPDQFSTAASNFPCLE